MKRKLAKPRKICHRIVRGNDGQLENIDEIYGKCLIKTAIEIVQEESYPLNIELSLTVHPVEEGSIYCRWEHLSSRTLLCQVPLSCSMTTILLYYLVIAFYICNSVTMWPAKISHLIYYYSIQLWPMNIPSLMQKKYNKIIKKKKFFLLI